MPPKRRIIIDTDPGTDDVVAMLLALAAPASELEVVLISLVEGNVGVHICLRNVVAMFQVLAQEIAWRESKGIPNAYQGVTAYKPIVAVGAAHALHAEAGNADYFHGRDGLAGSTTTHPEFYTDESWRKLFEGSTKEPIDKSTGGLDRVVSAAGGNEKLKNDSFTNFTPSRQPAHKEILRILRENEPDTISIISLGPLTNLALAAAEDPETFLRCRDVVSMGGVVDGIGNVTPNAEFNVWADPHAAARVYALSAPNPASTMPQSVESYDGQELADYPSKLSKQLKVLLLSLDITEHHIFTRTLFTNKSNQLASLGSPLAKWMQAFLLPMLDKMAMLHHNPDVDATFTLHDPLCIYYVLTEDVKGWECSKGSPEDIRVETSGRWTRGMTVLDRRPRRRRDSDGDAPHDKGNWLGHNSGNRIMRLLYAPVGGQGGTSEDAGAWMLDRILGYIS